MQTSSNRAGERAEQRDSAPVNITVTDLAKTEARFDSQIPGSAWCGYGTCAIDGALRLLAFVNLHEQRAITITRHGDGDFSLLTEDGALWPNATLDAILDQLTKIASE